MLNRNVFFCFIAYVICCTSDVIAVNRPAGSPPPPVVVTEPNKFNKTPIGALDKAILEDKNKEKNKEASHTHANDAEKKSVISNIISKFTAPSPPNDQKVISAPADQKKEDDKAKILFLSKPKTPKFDVEETNVSVDDLLKLNYDTNKFPPEYYAVPFSKANSHLPPVYFESYYAELAFKAVTKEDLGALRFFIDKYHLERKTDEDGNSLLIHAANQGKIDAARLLVVKKVDIDAVNLYGMTALHVAAIKGDFQMARLLLSMDADFSILDSNGKAAIDYAEENGYDDVIDLFGSYYVSASRNRLTHHDNKKTQSK